VGPRAGLDTEEKNLAPAGIQTQVIQLIIRRLYRLSYPDPSCINIHVHFMLSFLCPRLSFNDGLSLWNRVLLGKLIAAQLVKKFSACYRTRRLITVSQQCATGSNVETNESSRRIQIQFISGTF
jgi:hypothetical protein